jgi:hypothetical protein
MITGNNMYVQNMGITMQNSEGVFLKEPVPAPDLIDKSITENGEYAASTDNVDGYKKVTVDVAGGGGGETFEVNLVCDAQTSSFTTDKSYNAVKAAIQANKTINFIWSVLYQGTTAASGTSSAVSYDAEGDFMTIAASIVVEDTSGCYVFQWGNPEVYTTASTVAQPLFNSLK